MDRAERIRTLRGIIDDIRHKCEATCVQIGTWHCNHECPLPMARAVAEAMLTKEGEYVGRSICSDGSGAAKNPNWPNGSDG